MILDDDAVVRRKVLRVSPELLMRICQQAEPHCYRVIEDALPADARVVRVGVADPWIVLTIESETFERTSIYAELPQIMPIFEVVPSEVE